MARKGQHRQRPVKGFRPGKEPPRLKKERAKQQFGEVNAAQERLIEVFAERSPEEARAMLRRWRVVLLTGAIALGLVGFGLYWWSAVAGAIVQVLGAGLLFLWWQLHRKRGDLERMADVVSGVPPSRPK